jgi:hypothetical protein
MLFRCPINTCCDPTIYHIFFSSFSAGIRVGPEPTTDRFTAILWGDRDKIVPGAALCSQQDRPFTGLGPFGNNFLSRLEGKLS